MEERIDRISAPYQEVFDGKVCGACMGSYGYDPAVSIGMTAYLGTINNLQTPVKKTASQTMKITYTLTDASAQEA